MLGSQYLCGAAGQYFNAIVVSVREEDREGVDGMERVFNQRGLSAR